MEQIKEKYNLILLISEFMIGAVFTIFGFFILPICILLLIIGLVLLFTGVVDIIVKITVKENGKVIGNCNE